MTWTNDDGLVIRFGVEESTLSNVSAVSSEDVYRTVEIIIDKDTLPTVAAGSTQLDPWFKLDKGAFIESLQFLVTEAFDSTSDDLALSIGTIDIDGTADDNSLVDAATQTELNTVADQTDYSGWVGVAFKATLAKASYLTWKVDNHAATAGHAILRIKWSVPRDQDDTLVWSKS